MIWKVISSLLITTYHLFYSPVPASFRAPISIRKGIHIHGLLCDRHCNEHFSIMLFLTTAPWWHCPILQLRWQIQQMWHRPQRNWGSLWLSCGQTESRTWFHQSELYFFFLGCEFWNLLQSIKTYTISDYWKCLNFLYSVTLCCFWVHRPSSFYPLACTTSVVPVLPRLSLWGMPGTPRPGPLQHHHLLWKMMDYIFWPFLYWLSLGLPSLPYNFL